MAIKTSFRLNVALSPILSLHKFITNISYMHMMAGQPSLSSAALSAQSTRDTAPAPISDRPAKLSTYFTQSQLALALTIQKSKPEGVSTIGIYHVPLVIHLLTNSLDYCHQLRKRIKSGRSILNEEDHRYVDTSEFWKDQYTKIHLEKKGLEDMVHKLEEERRLLGVGSHASGPLDTRVREILGISDANHGITDSNSLKRSAPPLEDSSDIEVELAVPTTIVDGHLRLSSNGKSIFSVFSISVISLSLGLISNDRDPVLRIGRYRKNLDNIIKGPDNPNQIENLVKNCNLLLSLLDSALSDCCLPLRLLKIDSDDAQSLKLFQLVMNQAVLGYLSCFEALNLLCRTIPGRKQKPDVIYHMVMFFSAALNCLQTVSTLQTEHEIVQDCRRLHHKRGRMEEVEYAVNKYLAQALAWILQNLDWKVCQPGHSDLLEGILFLVLNHTGRLLSDSVFEEHVATTDTPGNITVRKIAPLTKATKLESRYIVQVLHAAIGGGSRKELVAQVLMANNPNKVNAHKGLENPAGSAAVAGDLLSKAKFLIQSTLVKSTVGGVGLDSLKLPSPPEEAFSHPIVSSDLELYGSDWLIEIVWALVGWDLVG